MCKLPSNSCKEFAGISDITADISRKEETCCEAPSIMVVMGDHSGNSRLPGAS
jgi:hypothetical protein